MPARQTRNTASATPPGHEFERLRDARSRRSQDLLKGALLRLIEDRPFERITLREIAAEAGVSYPTMFNHYAGKEDLFQDMARAEILGLLEAFRDGVGEPGWSPGRGMCTYVMQRRGVWRTLLTTGATQVMRSEFIRLGRELAEERDLGHGVPIDLVSGVIAGGTFEIMAWWLVQPADYPLQAVAAMLEGLVIEPALNLPKGYFKPG